MPAKGQNDHGVTLIKSISGIRGTIGGTPGDNLTAIDVVNCAAGYGDWLLSQQQGNKVIIGRDARISGPMVSALAAQTLTSLGLDVIDLGLSTTPTVEMAVVHLKAAGGIIVTASHNPKQWNALKFLNAAGEFISAEDGADILARINRNSFQFAAVSDLGSYQTDDTQLLHHIQKILDLPTVKVSLVQSRAFSVVVDCINSTGAISIPPLLDALGCKYQLLNDEMSGDFAHNPEPLPEHLQQLSNAVVSGHHDLGIVVDPDVDRLAFVCEDGEMFGEEYTIVALADYILRKTPGNTVSNLSSTQALKDITLKLKGQYFASAVGEVNVVNKMKETQAVFGGEGNGGVIYPALHYGRDALVGIALFLSHLAEVGVPVSTLKSSYPSYTIAKKKVSLPKGIEPDQIIHSMRERYRSHDHDTTDGLKLLLKNEWVHLRKSNTEPIIRIYAESKSGPEAEALAECYIGEIEELYRDLKK